MPRDAAQVQFDTLVIEGGLFTAEWLGKIANFAAPAQDDRDYQVRAGFTLREEIALAWRSAQALWALFDKGRATQGHDAAAVTQRFVTELLKQAFGFQLHAAAAPVMADGRSFPINHFAFERTVPVVAGVHTLPLDAADPRFGDPNGQRRRRSAFGLLQEYLNAQNTSLWGIASNGLSLRVARDNASLTRPAWLEVDLERLFQEERFAEFSVLWLLLHATRFGGENIAPSECVLERWRDACRDQGIRARDVLRQGVEQALLTLGNGFLSHYANTALRDALANDRITTHDFFQQLLRLVYRQIFLLTIEERGILHQEHSEPAARELYAEGYSLRSLRDRAVRRNAHDRHHDLWEGLKLVWKGLATGEPRLALPALGGLFAVTQCRDLDSARLENRYLLLALFHLAWLRDKEQPNAPLTRVNWRDMGPEELGSIYESLLELVPQVRNGNRSFNFLEGAEARGNARKTTGSYYTPDSLVQVLLASTLEPVITGRLAASPSEQPAIDALLSITVVDPACGSGHFLLAAARRIATHLARLMAEISGSGQPSPADYRHALRQVVGRCIYGVDLNPMAVELCKVGLWLEAVEPGLPLSFLDSHIQHGNALLGTTPELMTKGIPDAAWDPIEGDDKKTASALKKRNKKAAEGQRSLASFWAVPNEGEVNAVARSVAELEASSDADPGAIAKKESQWDAILGSPAYRHQKFIADAWCAAFLWPKQSGELADTAPTYDMWLQLRDAQGQPPSLTAKIVAELADQYVLFHWHLQFPQVFAEGGFDVVLGNPPWERVKLQEQEFFAARNEAIARAPNAAVRKKLIEALPKTNRRLWDEWYAASREAAGTKHFLRESGRYPLCGHGDVNTYAIFAEHNRQVLTQNGSAGFVVPTGLVTDDSTSAFFSSLMAARELAAFFSFENEDRIFPTVHHAFKFALLVIDRAKRSANAEFVFFARRIQEIDNPERRFCLSMETLNVVSPHTLSAPTFRSRRDAEIVNAVHQRMETLRPRQGASGWKCVLRRMIHMADDAGLFKTAAVLMDEGWQRSGNTYISESEQMLPLYEAKLVHHFDHRFSTYEGQTEAQSNQSKCPELSDVEHADPFKLIQPRYWIAGSEVESRLAADWTRGWVLGWRDICRSVDSRTMIASVIPRSAFGGFHQIRVYSNPRDAEGLYACLCSFIADYVARQKVGGTHLTYGILEQVPVVQQSGLVDRCGWSTGQPLRDWLHPRVLELTYTAWDLEPFARDVGYGGAPFRWDATRRFLLRCELDAAFFHLYGLSRDDTDYVMDTFPIVRKNDEKAHGEYRTKRVILEIYDEMADAIRTGDPYRTRLDPPPADPRIAHPNQRPAGATTEPVTV